MCHFIYDYTLGGVVVSVSDLRLKRSRFDSSLYHSGQQLVQAAYTYLTSEA